MLIYHLAVTKEVQDRIKTELPIRINTEKEKIRKKKKEKVED